MDIQVERQLTNSVLAMLVTLENQIFDAPLSPEQFVAELSHRKNLLLLIARVQGTLCGYKVGFEYDQETFFSWSGGVIRSHRDMGVATKLMARQHEIAKEEGYSIVRTHTKNKYREMLLLDIRAGFDITGVYQSLKEKNLSIVLEKRLA